MSINRKFVLTVAAFLPLVLTMLSISVDASAQSANRSSDSTTSQGSPVDMQEIKETLKQLQAESDKLQRALSNSNAQNSSSSASLLDPQSEGSQVKPQRKSEPRQIPRLPKHNQDATQIYRQIELIKQIIRSEQSQPNAKSPMGDGAVQGSPIPNPPQPQLPNQTNDTSALFDATTQSMQPPSQLPITEAIPSNVSQITSRSTRILPEPVDLFEMGNSLFATTDVGAALKAYDSVDRSKLNATDDIWLEYLTACCNRTLGDLDTAESIFRQVSNENGHAKLVESSRWWLKQIGRKRMAEENFSQLATEFESLMERANNHDSNRIK